MGLFGDRFVLVMDYIRLLMLGTIGLWKSWKNAPLIRNLLMKVIWEWLEKKETLSVFKLCMRMTRSEMELKSSTRRWILLAKVLRLDQPRNIIFTIRVYESKRRGEMVRARRWKLLQNLIFFHHWWGWVSGLFGADGASGRKWNRFIGSERNFRLSPGSRLCGLLGGCLPPWVGVWMLDVGQKILCARCFGRKNRNDTVQWAKDNRYNLTFQKGFCESPTVYSQAS